MQCFVGAVSIFQPGSLSKSINSRKAHHRRPRGVRPGSVRMQSIRTDGLESYSAGVSTLEGEGAYAVMAAASALEASSGQRVIHLEIGQPGFATPSNIAAAGSAAIDAGQTKYSAPAGTGELREAIASYVSQRGTVPATPAEIVVGPGAKPGLFFATLALVRGAQDQVIIPDPGFPTYKAMVAVAGGTPVPVPLRKDLAGPDIAALRRAVGTRTRLVVLNSPANPTGGVMPPKDLEAVAQLAIEHDFWVISDEIYSSLYYGASPTGAASIRDLPGMRDRTVIVDGFSKAFCMTGWRLGWAVMPPHLAERVELLLVHSVGCTATFTQAAGVEALRDPEAGVEELRRVYRDRRDIVVEGLNKIPGVSCATPAGAFYAFPDVSKFGLPSKEIAGRLLSEGFVAVLPGTDFGERGEGHIRISYVSEEAELREGIKRIGKVLSKIGEEVQLAV